MLRFFYIDKRKNTNAFLLQFTAAFIGLTIGSSFLYVNLYDEQIDPYNTVMFSECYLSFCICTFKKYEYNSKAYFLSQQSDLHGQMTSSLKDNFRSDNLTTGTKISNEWNHLFMDVSECKTFQSHTLNLLSKTFVLFNISV